MQVRQRVPEELVVDLDGSEVPLERLPDRDDLAPVGRCLLIRQLRRLGDVPAAPDHDRVAALHARSLQVGVGDLAGEDAEPEPRLVRPSFRAHRAALAATERVELGRPLHGAIILGGGA